MPLGRALILGSRWILLLLMPLTVWLWGTTQAWTREALIWPLLGMGVLFVCGLILSRRWPRVRWMLLLPSGLILSLGWLMTWNSTYRYDRLKDQFLEIATRVAELPGFFDITTIFPEMLLATGMIAAVLVASDLSANPVWRRRLIIVMTLSGLSQVLLGLLQRWTNAPAIFWSMTADSGRYFFGVYVYHANAGAFLNITLFLCFGLALEAIVTRARSWWTVLWCVGFLVTLGACFVNASRGAMSVTAVLLIIGALRAYHLMPGNKDKDERPVLAWLMGLLLIGALLAWCFGPDLALIKWKESSVSDSGRFDTYEALVRYLIPWSGFFGSGPGTFEDMFAYCIKENGLGIAGRWDFAHSDPLQCLVEWGMWGGLCWFLIFAGGLVGGVMKMSPKRKVGARLVALGLFLALLSVMLHSTIDFPFQIASIELYALTLAGLCWGRWT